MANSLWVGAVRKGLAANRPTVPDAPDDTFQFYYATDTGNLSFGVAGGSEWSTATLGLADAAEATGETGVTVTDVPAPVRKMTLTLDEIVVAVADADDFGSAALVTLPDTNMLIAGCEVDLELVKDGVGFIDSTDLDVALGTAAASNTTLSAGMINVLPKVDLNSADLSPALQSHSLAASPVLTPVLDGATNVLYLNVSGPTETSEDATITASGTVTLFYIDLGNITS